MSRQKKKDEEKAAPEKVEEKTEAPEEQAGVKPISMLEVVNLV